MEFGQLTMKKKRLQFLDTSKGGTNYFGINLNNEAKYGKLKKLNYSRVFCQGRSLHGVNRVKVIPITVRTRGFPHVKHIYRTDIHGQIRLKQRDVGEGRG